MTDRRSHSERGRVRVVGFGDAEPERRDRLERHRSDERTERDPVDTKTDDERSVRVANRRLTAAWRRFKRNRTAVVGLGIIVTMAVLAIFARPIEVTTAEYRIALQPLSLAPYDPSEPFVGPPNAGPSWIHPFGTDWAGRDQLSRVLVGGRYTLGIGLLAVALALCVGVPIGAVAGYVGGWVDGLCMRLVDVLAAVPLLVLAIAVVPLLEPLPVLDGGVWTVVVALVVTGWTGYARLLRGEVLSVRERDYVAAAEALGVPDRTILRRHVVPNAVAPVVVQATLNVGTVVLTAAALGFLGLGVDPGTAEWGAMLSRGRSSLVQGHWHITVFPGLAIFLFVLSINLVGDGITDALEPTREGTDDRRWLR